MSKAIIILLAVIFALFLAASVSAATDISYSKDSEYIRYSYVDKNNVHKVFVYNRCTGSHCNDDYYYRNYYPSYSASRYHYRSSYSAGFRNGYRIGYNHGYYDGYHSYRRHY